MITIPFDKLKQRETVDGTKVLLYGIRYGLFGIKYVGAYLGKTSNSWVATCWASNGHWLFDHGKHVGDMDLISCSEQRDRRIENRIAKLEARISKKKQTASSFDSF